MNRHNTLGLLVIMISGMSALNVSANGFRLASQDAFATARGEAFVATADNPSAIYYNPAGITQLEGDNLRAGLYGLYFNPSYTPPGPASTNKFHIKDKNAAVPQVFYTSTPKDLPLTFGFGIYAPYGASVSWPGNTGFRAIGEKASLTYVTANPVIALKVTPNLSVGCGVMLSHGDIDLRQGLTDSTNSLFRFKGNGWGLGYNLGLLWQPSDKVSFGASFRSSTTITMEGLTEWADPPWLKPNPTYRYAKVDFTFPMTAVVGISYRPTPKWNLEFNADYTDWSSLGTITFRQSDRVSGYSDTNKTYVLNWQSSWMYEFGATRYFGKAWQVSAGYAYNQNSVPDAHYTPLVADLNRHFFNVGGGFKWKDFNLDLAYQFGYGPARTVKNSVPPLQKVAGQSADGTYDFISHAFMVTVGVHF